MSDVLPADEVAAMKAAGTRQAQREGTPWLTDVERLALSHEALRAELDRQIKEHADLRLRVRRLWDTVEHRGLSSEEAQEDYDALTAGLAGEVRQ